MKENARTTSTGTLPTIDRTTIDAFMSSLHGELIQPGDDNYDGARAIYNGMIDRYPRFIVRCADADDVVAAVNFARTNDLTVAIRGGGHNGAGLSMCDDGLVIDLSRMREVRIDPVAQTIRVQGGATWGDVDRAAHEYGLVTPSGIISTTGVAGLTLGGGLGHLSRRFGLAIDSLMEAEMVLADGSMVRASATENPDLFWAIRGGGGNFGVVTSFLFGGHPLKMVMAGPTLWSMDQAPMVMRWYRDFILDAPETLNGFFAILIIPPVDEFPEELHGQTMCGVVWCYTGDPADADIMFEPVLKVGTPALHGVQSMPYPAMQSMFDPLYPAGMQWYWKADFVSNLSDEVIEKHIAFGKRLPSMWSTMHLYPINGAVHRVGADETAWAYRNSTWGMVIVGVDPDPANNASLIKWTKDYWEAIHPYSDGGAYVNMMMEEGDERVRASYGPNYERLRSIKAKYDPNNFFHVNQNIPPMS